MKEKSYTMRVLVCWKTWYGVALHWAAYKWRRCEIRWSIQTASHQAKIFGLMGYNLRALLANLDLFVACLKLAKNALNRYFSVAVHSAELLCHGGNIGLGWLLNLSAQWSVHMDIGSGRSAAQERKAKKAVCMANMEAKVGVVLRSVILWNREMCWPRVYRSWQDGGGSKEGVELWNVLRGVGCAGNGNMKVAYVRDTVVRTGIRSSRGVYYEDDGGHQTGLRSKLEDSLVVCWQPICVKISFGTWLELLVLGAPWEQSSWWTPSLKPRVIWIFWLAQEGVYSTLIQVDYIYNVQL